MTKEPHRLRLMRFALLTTSYGPVYLGKIFFTQKQVGFFIVGRELTRQHYIARDFNHGGFIFNVIARSMDMKVLFVLALVSLSLSGCGLSTFAQRETDPYILDIIPNLFSPVGISVTDSSRRLVYQFQAPPGTPYADPEGRGRFICADPSPDTAVAVAGAVSGDLSATVTAVAPNASGNGNIKGERTSGTSVAALLKRSQGLVWGRDQATIECLNFAAGLTDKREYLESLKKIRDKSTEIMMFEIEKGFHVMEVAKTEAKSSDLPTKEDSKKEEK